MALRGRLSALVGEAWTEALGEREVIPALAAGLAGLALGEEPRWRDSVLSRSVSLSLLAGSGSRWQNSLAIARAQGRLSAKELAFDQDAPRGLFPVRDFIHASAEFPGEGEAARGGRPAPDESPGIPIAAYSLAAVSSLASHVVVIRDHEAEIRRDIIAALGLDQGEWRFAEQKPLKGKPLGHGDAAWQSRGLWRDSDWLVANFGGDPNSRFTVEASLLALAALDAAGEAVDFLMPAALVSEPAYPIELGADGRPLSFGHAKLQGRELGAGREPGWKGLANVGLRLYRAKALAAVLEELHEACWVEGLGYAIPGNAPGNPEFALDNADAVFASRGRALVLAIARERELHPAKSYDEVPGFEAAMAEVVAEDRRLAISPIFAGYSRGSGLAT